MANFLQQVVSGIASGGIYASLALALVLIHRATGVINFAQGEMAMFSTYILWTLTTNHGWAYAPALVATLLVSLAGGIGIHQLVIRPNEKGSVLRVVIVTIGLLLAFNGLATMIWSGEVRSVTSPFGSRTIDVGGVVISVQDLGTIAVVLVTVVLLWALFQFTKVGLAMRAAAVNPVQARLVGVRVSSMLSLGWGLAAVLGAIAGSLAAPTVFLDPNMMQAILIYAFAAFGCCRTVHAAKPISFRVTKTQQHEFLLHILRFRRGPHATHRRGQSRQARLRASQHTQGL